MANNYPKRTEKELSVLTVFENSIKKLASDFYRGRALNYFHEAEIASFLLSEIRRSSVSYEDINGYARNLAHLEWPCIDSISNRIDLVIWKPGSCVKADELWGNRNYCAENLPLLAAVQIKRGPGKLTSWKKVDKDLKDLKNLYINPRLEYPILYYVECVDHGINEHNNDRKAYNNTQLQLKEWCEEEINRRAFVISRDRVGFAYPSGAWLTNPLPNGIKEHLD